MGLELKGNPVITGKLPKRIHLRRRNAGEQRGAALLAGRPEPRPTSEVLCFRKKERERKRERERKEEGRKEGRQEGRKGGEREGGKEGGRKKEKNLLFTGLSFIKSKICIDKSNMLVSVLKIFYRYRKMSLCPS